jgi:hypothetical protein
LGAEDWARDICNQATQAGLTLVADYWQNNSREDAWRCWKVDRDHMDLDAHVNLEPLNEELDKRKIPRIEGEEILQWGYGTQGTFSTREAYRIQTGTDLGPTSEIWQKIWNLRHWPKVTLFLWLVLHSSILTWDNLLKRGFTGPSIFILCGDAEETMNHILNTRPYSAQIWDQATIIMRTSDRLRNSIIETLENWRDAAFHSPILNRVW